MQNFIRGLLVVWFIALNVLVIVPGYQLLQDERKAPGRLAEPLKPPPPPTPEALPALDPKLDLDKQISAYTHRVSAFTQQVTAYTQNVSAYKEHLSAYKSYAEWQAKSPGLTAYQTVVKDTISPFLTAFLTSVLAYVFAKTLAHVVDSVQRRKLGKDPETLRL